MIAEPNGQVTNALSIDLEDWPQSVLDPRMPVTDRVVRNTDRMLALLSQFGIRATFFALGKVCEKFPQLLPTVASAGHEVATHGYGHELLHRITPKRFRDDLRHGIDIIHAQIGRRPIGYRAPAFSITRDTQWAGPIMVEQGIKYSSSVFPIAGRRYGIPNAQRFPHRWERCELVEFPLSTIRRWGRNFPVCGGGYFRLLPTPVVHWAVREINHQGQPVVVYLHPYELAVTELSELQRRGWHISWKTYIMQSLFRGRMQGRIRALFQAFRFAPLAEVLGLV